MNPTTTNQTGGASSALETARAELLQEQQAQNAALERRFALLAMLPAGDVPITCNFATPSPIEPRAWVSYSGPSYDPENKFDPVALLRAIEGAGWKLAPACALVKWDNYRPAMEPCDVATAATLKHPQGREYKDGDPVAAYWIEPSQHTRPDFNAFMVAPDGLTYRLSIDVPALPVGISCRRIEFQGGWRFDGPAHLRHPESWTVHHKSRAWRDTEQGISGAVYFHPDSAGSTASEALAHLLRKAKP